jgi:hypothetical protein
MTPRILHHLYPLLIPSQTQNLLLNLLLQQYLHQLLPKNLLVALGNNDNCHLLENLQLVLSRLHTKWLVTRRRRKELDSLILFHFLVTLTMQNLGLVLNQGE